MLRCFGRDRKQGVLSETENTEWSDSSSYMFGEAGTQKYPESTDISHETGLAGNDVRGQEALGHQGAIEGFAGFGPRASQRSELLRKNQT